MFLNNLGSSRVAYVAKTAIVRLSTFGQFIFGSFILKNSRSIQDSRQNLI
jgi:hypothetical protein